MGILLPGSGLLQPMMRERCCGIQPGDYRAASGHDVGAASEARVPHREPGGGGDDSPVPAESAATTGQLQSSDLAAIALS
jgi:hypothetical protein